MALFSNTFIKDAAERVIVTFAQAYISSAVILGEILDFDALKIAAGAAVLSFFKAIVASRIGDEDSASLAA